ncbi:MAG: type II secretion system F family protein [Alphaproteobacteria bacterium]|nr:type II secretion system F family protein [Alphaproteobacteria bacterium]
MEPLQIILIAAIVFILVAVIMFVMMNSGIKQHQKNIAIIRGISSGEGYVDEKDVQNKRRAEIAKKLKSTRDAGKKGQNNASISVKMQQAGLKPALGKFWALSFVSAIIFVVLAKFVFHFSVVLVGLFFVIGLFGLPRMILKRMIKKRQKKFLEEFADVLEAVVRLLKAGMPVSEAISMITREYDGPVGEEMSIIYDKQKIGIPLHEAALEGCKRMPLPEMKMFAAGLAIQAQTGSSLSEVLINLARVIRARFRLKRKVMALSSEAIASASIIACLPPLVATGLYFVSPGYLDPLFEEEFGNYLLMGALFWMFCGVVVMRQMINFKI